MFVVRVEHMKRSEKQIYALLKRGVRLAVDQIAQQTDYSERQVLRSLSNLRRQNLVRGVQDVRDGRRTYYELTDP